MRLVDALKDPFVRRKIMDELGYDENGWTPLEAAVSRALREFVHDPLYGALIEHKIIEQYPSLEKYLDPPDTP